MEIIINNKTIKLKKTFRSLIAYEKATGTAFSPSTITETIMYFYCVVIASDLEQEISYDEFMDWLDENPTALVEFTQWIIKQNELEDTFIAKKKSTKKKKENK